MRLRHREWSDLTSAHGDCSHIPEALAALVAQSEVSRQEARWRIDNHVVLQGDLYEGAPWVARELIALLLRPNLPDIVVILDLLVELALGSDFGEVISTSRGEMPVGLATKAIIAQAKALFEAEITSGDPRVAALAQQLLEEVEEWREEGLIALPEPL